jgi:hypothetical protein
VKILRSAHWVVDDDPERRIIRATRTEVPYADVAEAVRVLEELRSAFEQTAIGARALLIDVRAGPARNDDDFEAAVGRASPLLLKNFVAVAYVVRSAAGRLQVRRMASAGRGLGDAFLDEGEAIAYLDRALGRG